MSPYFPVILAFSSSFLPPEVLALSGGDEEVRTPDPLRARQVLSQLSYTPRFLDVLLSQGLQN